MPEHEPSHLLSIRIEHFKGNRYLGERNITEERYKGSPEDCDAIAANHDVKTLTTDLPPHERYGIPYHDRVYTRWDEDGSTIELWCHAEEIETSPYAHQVEDIPTVPNKVPEFDEFDWEAPTKQATLFDVSEPETMSKKR